MENNIRSNETRAWVGGLLALVLTVPANALTISDTPLFLTSGGKANVLVVLDNSNSMDEAANGSAVGSNSADSKSEIARSVVKGLVTSHTGKINMGLMAYQQNTSGCDPVRLQQLHSSPYDVSYNPANYDPGFTGARSSTTKRFRMANPSSPGNYIYYNIALPFYADSPSGNGFCYSPTAVFDNGSETKPTSDPKTCSVTGGGPWDTYRCFDNKTGSSDALPTWGDTTSETSAGYSGLKYVGPFFPTDSDLAQNILDFGKQNTWKYVSPTWFSNASPGRGFLHTPIALLDAAQAAKLNIKLGTSQFVTNAATNAAYPLQNAGLTPIEGTLLTAKDYFAGTLSKASEGYTASCYPLPTSCGHNYVVLVTDGLPSTAADGTVITDPSAAITAAAAAAAALKAAGVETYVVGFALPYGVDPATLNTIAASGGTGTAYSATDPATLTTALTAIFADIESKTSSAAAVATNSTRLNTDTLVYQARFNSGDWSGQIVAYPLESDGSLGAAKWDTDTSGKIPAAASRNIFTWNGTAQVDFKSANFASLNATQQAALNAPACAPLSACGPARIDWLRGDATQEVKNGGPFRDRVKPLGDVVNSDPLFVGADNYGYVKLGDADGGGPKYIDFLTWKQTREGLLFVGANDGMMHAFVASTGVEKFAYVPRGVYQNLSLLTQPGYTHKYFVDGPSTSADARIGSDVDTAPKYGWRTVLVGTLGAGGKGVFALDITDPSASDFGKPLWEVTSADTGFADLGYVMGAPQIVKLKRGSTTVWAAVFGNGYNSTGGTAKLFIVDLATGALLERIDAGSATANGLSAPAVYDGDENRLIGDYSGSTPTDAIYAGDLLGNVWKFGNSSSGWEVTYKSGGSTPEPLFTAKYGTQIQPITAPLEIGERPAGTSTGVMVYIGTGSYFTTDDRTNKDVQSLYGIWDSGTRIIKTDRSDLQVQSITHELTAFSEQLRVVSNNTVTWTGGSAKRGWYLDLIPPGGTAQGERVVSTPLLRHGRVIYTTLIPSTEACSFGGTSWLMEMTAATGGRLDYSVFDLDKNNLFNEKDYVTVTIDGVSVKVPASGVQSKVGITKAPAVVSAGSIEYKVASGTDTSGASKGVQVTKEKGTGGKPRTSWKQLFPEDK